MTTGVDAQTCKLIVLDSNIQSMTEFKQLIGRGTRINEEFGKTYFTILDFRNATKLFADKNFDGDPIKIKEKKGDEPLVDEDDDSDPEPYMLNQDDEDGNISERPEPIIRNPTTPKSPITPREKVFVNGVDVSILLSQELHFDLN